MHKTALKGAFSLLLASFLLISCSEFRRVQKSGDWKEKYDAAMKFYEEEEYFKTSTLLEEILPIIRGTQEAEKANFIFAYSYFNQKQFVLSAHHFKQFYDVYTRSEFALEALYMHAYSLYLQSPDFNLDQTPTYQAIAALQTFINRFPYSEYSEKATALIDELQYKLETKAYDNATEYYRLGQYKAAIVAFENFQTGYPDSRYQEEIAFLKVETEYTLAKQSFQQFQEERFRKTIEFYQEFVDKYPNSDYLKKAEDMYTDSLSNLEKLASND